MTTSYHVPSFQAAPSAPALTRTAGAGHHTHVPPPIRSGPAPSPDLVGPGLILALPVTRATRPSATGYSRPNAPREPEPAHRKANSGRAAAAPSKCRCAPPGVPHRRGWLRSGDGVDVVFGKPLVRPTPSGTSSPLSHTRAPRLGRVQPRWGGSTPNQPAAL